MIVDSDQLAWEKFRDGSLLDLKNILKKSDSYNRLICHTQNFFVVAGYGAFVEGYLLIIPKKLISSFAHLDEKMTIEFNWLKKLLFDTNNVLYKDTNQIFFEHGMCACMGGLDRAHLHLMKYDSKNKKYITNAINKALKKRVIGIDSIILEGERIINRYDLSSIINKLDEKQMSRIQINGSLKKYEDIKEIDLDMNDYPLNLKKSIESNKPYIYFDTGDNKDSFITFEEIDTQLGREICFYINFNDENDIKNLVLNHHSSYDPSQAVWMWQNYMFEKNIVNTIKKYAFHFSENINKINKEFNFKSFS